MTIFIFDLLKSPMPFAFSWRLKTFDPAMNKAKMEKKDLKCVQICFCVIRAILWIEACVTDIENFVFFQCIIIDICLNTVTFWCTLQSTLSHLYLALTVLSESA